MIRSAWAFISIFFIILLCGYKLFSCLTNSGPKSALISRLRGNDDGERFVNPAEAGGKQPKGDSDPAFIMQ